MNNPPPSSCTSPLEWPSRAVARRIPCGCTQSSGGSAWLVRPVVEVAKQSSAGIRHDAVHDERPRLTQASSALGPYRYRRFKFGKTDTISLHRTFQSLASENVPMWKHSIV